MTRRSPTLHRNRGFTLVEAIVVIVITGIVATFTAVFIRLPVQGYVDTAERLALADGADTALGRINRELRLALPNSVQVSNGGTTLQFVLTKAGGRYVDVNDAPPPSILPLRFDRTSLQFDIVGPAPAGRAAILPDDLLVINNTGAAPSHVYLDNRDNVAQIAAIAGSRVTLRANNLGTQSPPPYRFRIVAGTVTYDCRNGRLLRHFTRSIPTPVAPAIGAANVVANQAQCAFGSVALPTQAGTELVSLSLRLSSASGESIALIRQTQVENLP
ncbi:prepilin-type N-terminal cleavage/methylation domain-containing protein [Pseudoduganella chitinolytica]|uniref:Prepilin-type N-terminal cleavage/methylation domain-containing protein n=1 Tax=Pseudoduganella chitinolytica TaxID=34070 RepID=A0ABY8BIK9_9BURK|nr:prepilin-type N-terminal cleavage/methylation domain-containing protein [Pseudoduganella chitinolytica]WEF34783.1 prepilin-type N-terminal cleavage/methylation domain-containing protein [Pseudoduganella chitinolytica]